ncbi:hypothetical protein BJV77DRAFT_98031 [Russula vinacea]|nr:hypothetical protein BJV77DRAFT_98031 [Russula vinacea]
MRIGWSNMTTPDIRKETSAALRTWFSLTRQRDGKGCTPGIRALKCCRAYQSYPGPFSGMRWKRSHNIRRTTEGVYWLKCMWAVRRRSPGETDRNKPGRANRGQIVIDHAYENKGRIGGAELCCVAQVAQKDEKQAHTRSRARKAVTTTTVDNTEVRAANCSSSLPQSPRSHPTNWI